MKLFKDVKDGEKFVLPNGQQLIRVSESSEYNAVDTIDSSKGFFIADDDETYTVDEFWADSEEVE
ncbi:hypothetical protein PWKp16_00171 [Klebsiella phage PWKp16]|nr:hypothetical protein PWKp16_00171 [Klebsiella phage PWKp16]